MTSKLLKMIIRHRRDKLIVIDSVIYRLIIDIITLYMAIMNGMITTVM